MPSLETMRRVNNIKYNGAKTIGQIHKEESDWLMNETFFNDPQAKVCYIYDFYHDDQPDKKSGMTYENTTKTKIDAKFIVTKYQSLDKDQVEYHLQFRPSQKTFFDDGDELYYFEKEYRDKYGNDDFIGLYVDIPDEKNIYRKWLICSKEIGNQFIKYSILPCDYYLHWIDTEKDKIIKRKMWCVSRAMNSYTSGRWLDRYMLGVDDIQKIWLPLNSITEKFSYKNDNGKNKRIVLSALVDNPLVWQVSKCENTKPIGILKMTLDQDNWDENTDYINKETGEMYADYYSYVLNPENTDDTKPVSKITGIISASTYSIKVGGSYKTLSLKLLDENGNDVTNDFSNATLDWTCKVDNEDLTNIVTWLKCTDNNKQKIKFPNNRDYLGKILTITCTIIDEHRGYFYAHKEFELII